MAAPTDTGEISGSQTKGGFPPTKTES